ncbi:MAG: RecQ family ATP-dependent DNA helicase, partial [Myxococcota bacterium]
MVVVPPATNVRADGGSARGWRRGDRRGAGRVRAHRAADRPGGRGPGGARRAGRPGCLLYVQVLLPTGGGKSLCYQLPAAILADRGAGPTLVVSPLVALMDDQVRALRARGIAAAALHRETPYRERDRVLATLGDQVLVYASPERIANPRFRRALAGRVARVAVDEAHCISEWGHDFRPDYLGLGVVTAALGAPTIATTATATPRVMDEIRESLGLRDPVVIRGRFARDNLALSVEHLAGDHARTARVVALLDQLGLGRDPAAGRAVIYAATRARTVAVAKALTAAGFAAGYYHAGRTGGARATASARFADGRQLVMVATTAFGMGIDRPDVRLVVHVQAPSTLEAFAQQAGRAGRDGAPARCVVLY